MDYLDVVTFFDKECIKSFSFTSELEMKKSIDKQCKYVYLIIWSTDNIYSWGTMSGTSNRIRKSSILNNKLFLIHISFSTLSNQLFYRIYR